METKIMEIAERIKGLRELMDLPVEAMAQATGTTVEEYLACENGMNDFSFTFLFKCAEIFGVDMIEILTGDRPKLSFYTIVRQGNGLPIKRRKGFTYNHLAHLFQHKLAEPFLVTAPYDEEEQQGAIHLSNHEGQEFDYILSGQLEVAMEDHIELLEAGDCIYYDSSHGHGMRAVGGAPCNFLAIILKKNEEKE